MAVDKYYGLQTIGIGVDKYCSAQTFGIAVDKYCSTETDGIAVDKYCCVQIVGIAGDKGNRCTIRPAIRPALRCVNREDSPQRAEAMSDPMHYSTSVVVCKMFG